MIAVIAIEAATFGLRGKLKEIRTVFDALDVYPADALLGECEPSPLDRK
jgi:hypothetical protein